MTYNKEYIEAMKLTCNNGASMVFGNDSKDLTFEHVLDDDIVIKNITKWNSNKTASITSQL